MILATRLNNINEPQTIAMSKAARELAAKGHDVINLSLGEPDFETPKHIKDAAIQAINNNFTYYTPVAGIPDLKEAICSKLLRDNNLNYKPENIMVSTGAKQSIMNALLAILNPDDEIIIPTPYWVSYSEMAKISEGVPVFIDATLENNFKITPQQLEQAITPKSKAFIFSSPCNPTGSVYSFNELEALAKVFEKHPNIYIISDEIYEYINFVSKHNSIAQFDSIKDQVIIINGMSKGFAMTGWRLGYMAAAKEIAQACEKIQGQFTSGSNSITQKAAVTALTQSLEPTMHMKEAFNRRRLLVQKELNKIPGIKCNNPEGAFYFFVNIGSFLGKSFNNQILKTATDLCMYLLNNAYVSLVTGEAFGAPNYIRISYATSDEKLKDACNRIGKALAKLA